MIRFSLVDEDKDYFSKEKLVFKIFISNIVDYLKNGYNVIADATHLNPTSREKLFNAIWEKIDLSKVKVVGVVMRAPLNVCKIRNEQRKGTRSYVPTYALTNMFNAFKVPTYKEYNHIFDEIYIVENNKVYFKEKE